jgi:hypothetical protein
MRISKLLLIGMCCLLIPPAVWGQAANGQTRSGILGYLNPQTHTFHALRQVEAAEPPALTTFTGTVTLTITITLKSAGITNIDCVGLVGVSDGSGASARSFSEFGFVAATGTGSTRTCKVSIPYSWGLATQSTDTMTTSYEVSNNPFLTSTPPDRTSILTPVDTRKVPANGANTALTANVTL